ncbi:iron-siderophore ABC transporter substrate-binding protein [Marinivivus vitaminiproducens]|uniref:iron-siderophore ABC transporter substrate-binding protein n=1 Tax=Marinivivus vitaminiproducens TaxID=3035935 RepID=UPI0027A6AA69|nr:iron-siderophore ABC transporter substrate-binding protein [Geminicoccaceae bacterium SCSIO 64248]
MRRFGISMRAVAACAALVTLLPAGARAQECAGRLFESPVIEGGALCVPEEPERVVVLDSAYNLQMGLELGAPIVGAPLTDYGTEELSPDQRARVTNIGTGFEPGLEAIVLLDPDLILGDSFLHGERLDTLSQIAPTALIKTQDWKAYFRTIADLVNRNERAERMLGAYEARAADIRARMPDVTVSFLRVQPNAFHVYVDGPAAYAPARVMAEAGVRRTAYETVTDDTVLKRPGWESLSALSGDILLYLVGAGRDDALDDDLDRETQAHPLWQALPAVEANRAFRVKAKDWVRFGGIASANRVLDVLEAHVVAPR